MHDQGMQFHSSYRYTIKIYENIPSLLCKHSNHWICAFYLCTVFCWIHLLLFNSKQFPAPWTCKVPAPKSQRNTTRTQWLGLGCRECASAQATENIRLAEWICQTKRAVIHTAQPVPRKPFKWSDDAED